LEIVSPGGFIGGITPENVLRHPPIHRNELLARVFQSVGLVNRVGLGVDRIYEGLLRLGKDVPRYSSDESHVRLVLPLTTDQNFVLFIAKEERAKGLFELDDLLILRELTKTSSLDRWSAARALQLSEEEAAARLVRLRGAGYLIVRGRGRGAAYDLRRDLAERLRGRAAVDASLPLEEEAVRLRILALLRERGKLSNEEIRKFSGFNRTQVYRLVKVLETEGKVRFAGKGRGAHLLPADSNHRTSK
jgi:ATP-dependent DNA helicase RecG